MIRIFIWAVVCFTMTTFSGCSDGPEPLFNMEVQCEFKIPPGLNTFDTHYFYIHDVPTFIDGYLQGPAAQESISSISSRRADVSSLFQSVDWGIIREIVVHVISPSNTELSKEAFYQDRINPSNVNELELFSSLSNVKDILLEDKVTVEVRLKFRRIPPIEIDSRLIMNFVANGAE